MKKICIVAGDPNSINSEIIFKALSKLNKKSKQKIILIGSFSLVKKQLERLKLKINLFKIDEINQKANEDYIKIINVPVKFNDCFKVSRKNAANYVINCLNFAHDLCVKGKIKGFINCPIEKKLIAQKDIFGVTEFLSKKDNKKKFSEVMFLYNRKLSVVPITTHIKIKDVSRNIRKQLILKKMKTLFFFYKKLFKNYPKVAVLGLNPHNNELSKDSEEIKEILPAIKILKKNYKISGPMVADNFFKSDYKAYNVVVGMYHDQVLIPFKHLFRYNAINITLGLSYLRVSPDHGTARDIVFNKKANPRSLLECIKFLDRLYKNG